MRKKIAVFVNGYGMEALNATLKGIKQSETFSNYDFFIFVSYASYDTQMRSTVSRRVLNSSKQLSVRAFP